MVLPLLSQGRGPKFRFHRWSNPNMEGIISCACCRHRLAVGAPHVNVICGNVPTRRPLSRHLRSLCNTVSILIPWFLPYFARIFDTIYIYIIGADCSKYRKMVGNAVHNTSKHRSFIHSCPFVISSEFTPLCIATTYLLNIYNSRPT